MLFLDKKISQIIYIMIVEIFLSYVLGILTTYLIIDIYKSQQKLNKLKKINDKYEKILNEINEQNNLYINDNKKKIIFLIQFNELVFFTF